ncbi:conserved hypothetical protein [Abyssogena phaseoliformis symbiont OG214]|nr:conserved hypothetical protein [Abyssogena phaseoliformis symbiont OG214]
MSIEFDINKLLKTIIEKDGDGYLAQVEGHQNLFAFAYSEKEAIIESKNVVEMMKELSGAN